MFKVKHCCLLSYVAIANQQGTDARLVLVDDIGTNEIDITQLVPSWKNDHIIIMMG